MDQIQIWPNNIVNITQQLGDATSQCVDYAQILLDLLLGRNRKLAAVARQGIDELQRCGDVNDREKWTNQRYEFRKQVWEEIRNRVAEKIQFPGSHLHQDVLANLVTGCASFRGELGIQLGGTSDVQGQLAQEMQHLANDVGNKPVQNDQGATPKKE